MKRSTFKNTHGRSKNIRPLLNTRELPPYPRQGPKGLELMCPFCVPTHPLVPGQLALCGTVVRLMAIQTTIPVRTVREKNLTCVKCGQTGEGIMVSYHGQYIHLKDCKPGTLVMAPDAYEFSARAERVFHMKDGWWKNLQIKRYGKPEPVNEVDPGGQKTGKILGYVFMKV